MGYAYFFAVFVFALLLIPLGGDASEGAANGMRLFFECLIPSLFPFLVCSKALINNGKLRSFLASGKRSSLLIAWIASALCGTPASALLMNERCSEGMSLKRASFLCAVMSLVNPGFLIYALALSMLGTGEFAPLLAISHYAPSLICVLLIALFSHRDRTRSYNFAKKSETINKYSQIDAIGEAVTVMLRIGGTVIFFGVLFSILEKLGVFSLFQAPFDELLKGIIEMTNGLSCISSNASRLSVSLCAFLISFGGICIFAQSKQVFPKLSALVYFPVKLIFGAVSFAIAYILFPFFSEASAVFANTEMSSASISEGADRTLALLGAGFSAALSVCVSAVFAKLIRKGGRV